MSHIFSGWVFSRLNLKTWNKSKLNVSNSYPGVYFQHIGTCAMKLSFKNSWQLKAPCRCSARFQKRFCKQLLKGVVKLKTKTFITLANFQHWPQIPQKCDLGKQLNLMIHLQNFLKTSLQNVLKMSWRHLARRLQDVLKISWKRLGKMSWKLLEDVLKAYEPDECIGLD